MRYTLIVALFLFTVVLNAQTSLVIEGKSYSNSEDTWYGVNIARTVPTALIFRNNSITSINRYGYLLSAGDEVPGVYNTNLNGAVITGNVITWNGTPEIGIIPHGIFTGYNVNVKVKYNYVNKVPMAIIRKSNGMTDVSGAVAYNIIKDPGIGIVIKGMNGVRIYNNTFYSSLTTSQTNRALIDIYENPSVTPAGTATGTKVFNNIFYTKNNIRNISITSACRHGFQSDYNIYYCESGTPTFSVDGSVKTFTEWQAMGYDTHSKVINPNFKDLVSFVPAARLDHGTDLGTTWAEGLSTNAKWGTTSPETAMQNGVWQVGAMIYKESATTPPTPVNSPPSVNISSPTKSTAFIAPATITIDASASDSDGTVVKVEFYNGTVKLGERTTTPWSFTWKEVSEGTYSITAAATDNSGSRTVSSSVNVVVEKAAPTVNQAPSIAITTPLHSDSFEAPITITLTAAASDPDGLVTRVEYYMDDVVLGESFLHPFPVSFQSDTAGTFQFRAVAYDNMNASAVSAPIVISFRLKKNYHDLVNLYPSPNSGLITVELDPEGEFSNDVRLTILSLNGITIYSDHLETGEASRNINISDSFPGVYIMRISDYRGILTTKRFIKF
ncbi:MAG: Ig-like domain-containing protein [Bacteroidales bacterium]